MGQHQLKSQKMETYQAKGGTDAGIVVPASTSSGHQQPRTELSNPLETQKGRPEGQARCHVAVRQMEGRPVLRDPEHLRLHRTLGELDLIDLAAELNEAVRVRNQFATEPILVTTNGTILAGFGRWQLSILDGQHEIDCIEYSLTDDESLQFILNHHKPQRGWNAFARIRIALTLELYFQKRALDNMRAGGKFKGSANLPEARHMDVRHEIAQAAGVGDRNVSNVKILLKAAHPRLIAALRDGTLTINRAMQFCKSPKNEQLEQFLRYCEERVVNKVIRGFVNRPEKGETSSNAAAVLDALKLQEARQPGSIEVRVSRLQRTVIFAGQDLLTGSYSPEGV